MPKQSEMVRKSKRWQAIESAVAVLEAGLAPGSRVQHNVFLVAPDTKNRRQCDVVITSGQPPRETRTIVEVQARKKKVGIGQFHSWLRKQETLQVQHLLCVSTAGFVPSVEREARTLGNAVRLLTLLPSSEGPPRWEAKTIQHEMEILTCRDAGIIFEDRVPPEGAARVDAPILRWERSRTLISIMDIAEAMLRSGEARELRTTSTGQGRFQRDFFLSFEEPGNRVWLPTSSGDVVVCNATITDQVERRTFDTPIEVLSYEQFEFNGILGWAILARGEYEGREFHSRMVVMSDGKGGLRISQPHLVGLDSLIIQSRGMTLVVGQDVPVQGSSGGSI